MTEMEKGNRVCLRMIVSKNLQLQTLSNRNALECGVGQVTEVFKDGLVSVAFPNGSRYTRTSADIFELESVKKKRDQEQGKARALKFSNKYKRYAA